MCIGNWRVLPILIDWPSPIVSLKQGCTIHLHDVTLTLGDFLNAGTAVVENYRYPVRHSPIRRFFTVEYGQREDSADFIATKDLTTVGPATILRFFSLPSGFSVSLPSSTATRKTDDSSLSIFFQRGQG